jgi:hypothetical protein
MNKEKELYHKLLDLLHEAKDDPCSGLKIFKNKYTVEYQIGSATIVLPKELAPLEDRNG